MGAISSSSGLMLPVLPPTGSAALPARTAADPQSPQKPLPGLIARLAAWRTRQLLKRALRQAGDPNLVLDLPCGDGGLWPLLARHSNRVILAADSSADVLQQAQALQPSAVVERVRLLQTSAFAIDLPANAVECICCMRLFHRLATSKQRVAMLDELRRVTSDSVVISVQVDNIYRPRPAGNGQMPPPAGPQQPLLIPPAVIEAEFSQAGFRIVSHYDLLPVYTAQRIYVLRKEYKK